MNILSILSLLGRKPNCRLGSRFEAHLGTDELPKFSFFAALKNGPDV
jgi:hypothetical protein